MKTIVAPTDFSAASINAVNYAADLACVISTNLAIIHVCQTPVAISEVPVSEYTIEELVTDAERQMDLLQDAILSRTEERIKVMTEIKQGEVVRELNAYCATVDTYAIVMGPERAGAFDRTFFGGRTLTAIQQLSWPLIVVPSEVKFAGVKRIGLACDLNRVVDTIPLAEIRSLVKELHAEFHVLHVSTEKKNSFDAKTIEETSWLQDILAGLEPKYHFINDTDIEKNLAEFAEKNNIDLLIVIPKKQNLFTRLLHRSHSRKLVLHTHVPVATIHE